MSSSDEAFVFTTPGGIPYRLHEGPTFEAQIHGALAGRVTFIVHTTNATRFLRECLPTPRKNNQSIDPTTGGVVLILSRSYCPMIPSGLRPDKFSVEGLSQDKPLNVFQIDERPRTAVGFSKTYERLVKITIDFSTNRESLVDGELRSDRPEDFLEPSLQVNAEVLSINPNKLTKSGVSAGGDDTKAIKDISAPFIKLIPVIEETHTWKWAMDPDFNTIFGMLGHVNASTSLPFLKNPPAQTAMFLGVSGKLDYRWTFRGTDTAKQPAIVPPSAYGCWTLDFKFAKRFIREPQDPAAPQGATNDYGWNHIFDPERQQWRRLWRIDPKDESKKTPLYVPDDFTKMFLVLS